MGGPRDASTAADEVVAVLPARVAAAPEADSVGVAVIRQAVGVLLIARAVTRGRYPERTWDGGLTGYASYSEAAADEVARRRFRR